MMMPFEFLREVGRCLALRWLLGGTGLVGGTLSESAGRRQPVQPGHGTRTSAPLARRRLRGATRCTGSRFRSTRRAVGLHRHRCLLLPGYHDELVPGDVPSRSITTTPSKWRGWPAMRERNDSPSSQRSAANPGSPRVSLLRVKGETERDIAALGYECVEIFQPATLLGDQHQPRSGQGCRERDRTSRGTRDAGSTQAIPAGPVRGRGDGNDRRPAARRAMGSTPQPIRRSWRWLPPPG